MFFIPRTGNPYPAEFRERIVALAKSGRSVESLAREFEPCVATIHGWIKQAEIDGEPRDDGLTSAEREDFRRHCHGNLLRLAAPSEHDLRR
ncbi:MAG: transposase [Rhizobiaceae bacterium]|nr:transposase [Rhizobiaceae bacterium]